eukprot:348879-Pleurochrysis_carterae.AAC.1
MRLPPRPSEEELWSILLLVGGRRAVQAEVDMACKSLMEARERAAPRTNICDHDVTTVTR